MVNPVQQVKRMLMKDLALALGISGAMVSKLAKRGMPTHDADAARRWRRRHLNPAQTKGNRFDAAQAPVAAAASGDDGAEALAYAQRMVDRAAELLPLGKLAAVVGDLRLAMHRVPLHQREALLLPMELWDGLVGDILRLVPAEERQPGASEMSDDEADEAGAFWFSVAAGEFVLSGEG
jgi:hypothetical protein